MKNRRITKVIAILVVLCIAAAGFVQVRNMYLKAQVAKAEAAKEEARKREEARKKTNEWYKKDGKSYYYGEDSKVVIGRFVQDNCIYYTDEEGAVVRKVDGTKPMVAITYDDGPSQFTDDFVELFNEYDSQATFYEVGDRIDEFEEESAVLGKSIHELGNHTYTHQNLTRVSTDGMNSQVNRCNEKLRKIGATQDTITVRPPEGGFNANVKENLAAPIIMWSVDTLDWKSRNADSVHKVATTNIKDGDIILMHSLYESTLEASKRIVPELKEQGFQLVTVTDLAEFRGGLKNGQVYFEIPPIKEEVKEEAKKAKED